MNLERLVLIILSATIVCSLTALYVLRLNNIISLDQYHYTFILILVGTGIISSALKLPREKFNLPTKVISTAILLLALVILAIFIPNAFSQNWQSTAVIGAFGVVVIGALWIIRLWVKRNCLVE